MARPVDYIYSVEAREQTIATKEEYGVSMYPPFLFPYLKLSAGGSPWREFGRLQNIVF